MLVGSFVGCFREEPTTTTTTTTIAHRRNHQVPRDELAVGVEDSEGEVKPVGLTPKSQRANELDLNGLNGL